MSATSDLNEPFHFVSISLFLSLSRRIPAELPLPHKVVTRLHIFVLHHARKGRRAFARTHVRTHSLARSFTRVLTHARHTRSDTRTHLKSHGMLPFRLHARPVRFGFNSFTYLGSPCRSGTPEISLVVTAPPFSFRRTSYGGLESRSKIFSD